LSPNTSTFSTFTATNVDQAASSVACLVQPSGWKSATMAARDRAEIMTKEEQREVRYHVYVRLPFRRGDFVDPPPVRLALCPPGAL